jgi:hypothetical protein
MGHIVNILVSVTVIIVISKSTYASVPIENFFPFGSNNGDDLLATGDDTFQLVNLNLIPGFAFFNNSHSSLYVNVNGAISFNSGVSTFTPECEPVNMPMIAPFWADIDTRVGGQIFFRESVDPTLRTKAANEIKNVFPQFSGLELNWLFIATWNDVGFYGADSTCNGRNLRNTLQAVLATDSTHSFAIFNYNDVTWTTGRHDTSGGNCTGLGGLPAKAGFDVGDGLTFYKIQASCTDEIVNIDEMSNTMEPGKWIFRIDDVIIAPCRKYVHSRKLERNSRKEASKDVI